MLLVQLSSSIGLKKSSQGFWKCKNPKSLKVPNDSLDFLSLSSDSHFLFCLSGLPGRGLLCTAPLVAADGLAGLSRESCRGQGASWCQGQVFSSHLMALRGWVKAREPQRPTLALVV